MIQVNNSKIAEFRTAPCDQVLDNSYLLKRVDDGNGMSAVAKATGAANEDIVGMAHVSPIAATSRAVVGEEGSPVSGRLALDHPGVVAGSYSVYNVTQDAAIANADITLDGNELVIAGTTPPADTDVLRVNYRREVTLKELKQEGLPLDFSNNVNGVGGAAEFATGKSTVYTDFFDAKSDWKIGAKVYANAEGLPTTSPVESGAAQVGTVDTVPSAEYPILGVAMDVNF